MFGAVFFALASLCSIKKPEKFTHFPIEEVYPTTYAIFNTSGLCYIFISWCNLQISASLVTATWPLQMFFCFIFSYLMLGELLKALEFIGGVTIILGLAVVFWLSLTEEKTNNKEKEALNGSYSFVKVSQYDAFTTEGQILI